MSPVTTGGVRYVRVGDASIAYRMLGTEGPCLLDINSVVPGVLASEHAVTRQFWERLSRVARVLLFDAQGTGRSDPLPADGAASVEAQVTEAAAVLASAGIERAWLCGTDAGGAVAIMLTVQRPELVSGLVLVNAFARVLVDDDYPWGVDRSTLDRYLRFRREQHGTGRLLDLIAPSVANDPEVREFWLDYEQQASSPAQAKALSRIAETLDVRALLPEIDVPTLVIQTSDDALIGAEHGRYLATHIPNARLVEIPGRDHVALWESGEIVSEEIETFVTGVRPVARGERVLAAVLFTDLVGSTERARELGDRRWRRMLDEQERRSSEQVERCRGRVVKHTGDGVLATFVSASDAIRCVLAIQEAVRHLGFEIHAGINVGDIVKRGGDISGSTVNIAARVMAEAAGGEVLLTTAAYEAAIGSGVRFSAAGEHSLKGLSEPRVLYRLEHGEGSRAP